MLEQNMLSENKMGKSDVAYLARVIGVLAKNFDKLDASRRLTTIKLLMRVAFMRDASEIVIPPMDDLETDEPQPRPPKKNKKNKKARKTTT